MPLTPTPDTTRDLTELWDAMGEAGIRPGEVKVTDDGDWYYNIDGEMPDWATEQEYCERLLPQHALDILTGHAERWLRGRWASRGELSLDTNVWFYGDSLVEAILEEHKKSSGVCFCKKPSVDNDSICPNCGCDANYEAAAIRAECGRGK